MLQPTEWLKDAEGQNLLRAPQARDQHNLKVAKLFAKSQEVKKVFKKSSTVRDFSSFNFSTSSSLPFCTFSQGHFSISCIFRPLGFFLSAFPALPGILAFLDFSTFDI